LASYSNVISEAHLSHSQKNSVRRTIFPALVTSPESSPSASISMRNSLPWWKYRKEAEQDGLAHFESIEPHRLKNDSAVVEMLKAVFCLAEKTELSPPFIPSISERAGHKEMIVEPSSCRFFLLGSCD
jgi:hypothetical protein